MVWAGYQTTSQNDGASAHDPRQYQCTVTWSGRKLNLDTRRTRSRWHCQLPGKGRKGGRLEWQELHWNHCRREPLVDFGWLMVVPTRTAQSCRPSVLLVVLVSFLRHHHAVFFLLLSLVVCSTRGCRMASLHSYSLDASHSYCVIF